MLKGNLSTRPFYNERLITLAIALVAVGALALTIFNAQQLIGLSSRRGELRAQIVSDQAQAKNIENAAEQTKKSVDLIGLRKLAGSTHEANTIIDQRTFSWTSFFGLIEKTLPLDVRLVAVSPRIEKGERLIGMVVVSRAPGDVNEFIKALDQTGVFYDVLPKEQQPNDDGTWTTQIQAGYFVQPVEAAPAKAGGRGRP